VQGAHFLNGICCLIAGQGSTHAAGSRIGNTPNFCVINGIAKRTAMQSAGFSLTLVWLAVPPTAATCTIWNFNCNCLQLRDPVEEAKKFKALWIKNR
jgi:hypothetical protein